MAIACAVASMVPDSFPQLIPLTAHAILEKAETSARIIINSAKFDGISAVPQLLITIVQDDGGGAAYCLWVPPPEIWSAPLNVNVIDSILGLHEDGDGNRLVNIVIQL